MLNDENIMRLQQAIEEVACRSMRTPKDFDYLSELIKERLHETVSASTLKRFFGYVSSPSLPRQNTLDILSTFVGYKDWEAFCQQTAPSRPTRGGATMSSGIPSETQVPPRGDLEETTSRGDLEDAPPRGGREGVSSRWRWAGIMTVTLIVVAVAALLLFGQRTVTHDAEPRVLRAGQSFASVNDYLRLFGIDDTSNAWSKPLPHLNGIIVWGPQYHHPEWHNDGNRSSLMPTITEYWQPIAPLGIDSSIIAARNSDNYLRATTFRELRITFMKDLSDSTYTFLGIYRLSETQSDSSRLVWERVLDSCDLSALDQLELLRD